MTSIKDITKTIGSMFLLMSEASRSYKIDLISKLVKPEIRNIKH